MFPEIPSHLRIDKARKHLEVAPHVASQLWGDSGKGHSEACRASDHRNC